MTRRELFDALFAAASGVYDAREARSVAHLLAERIYGVSRADIAVEPQCGVAAGGLASVLAELSAGRPAQYIAGTAWFCGLEFAVAEGVLIPRPETEELVEWIAAETVPEAAILDIGTGSGAIAVALAGKVAGSNVHAVDISERALVIAAGNAIANGRRVSFAQLDILGPDGCVPWPAESFDIVVSNPPYIPDGDRTEMHQNVTGFEPHEALFVPDGDPLVFYKAISRKGLTLLKPGGALYFEIYEHSAASVCDLLAAAGYTGIGVRQDINGRDRMVKAVKP